MFGVEGGRRYFLVTVIAVLKAPQGFVADVVLDAFRVDPRLTPRETRNASTI
jgi:hypothetical protein